MYDAQASEQQFHAGHRVVVVSRPLYVLELEARGLHSGAPDCAAPRPARRSAGGCRCARPRVTRSAASARSRYRCRCPELKTWLSSSGVSSGDRHSPIVSDMIGTFRQTRPGYQKKISYTGFRTLPPAGRQATDAPRPATRGSRHRGGAGSLR
jgi:hypothetical protein